MVNDVQGSLMSMPVTCVVGMPREEWKETYEGR